MNATPAYSSSRLERILYNAKMRTKPLFAIASLFLVGGAFIYGQETAKSKATAQDVASMKGPGKYIFAKLNSQLAGLESDNEKRKQALEIAQALGPAMQDIAENQSDSISHSASLLRGYFIERQSARSAPQVSQIADEANVELNALLASQNAVIIGQQKKMLALLEKIANKK